MRGTTEEKNTLDTSLGACDIALAYEPNIIAASMIGYFDMLWPTHVFLWHPPLLDQRGGSLGTVGANLSNKLCPNSNDAGELSPILAIDINSS